MEKKLSSLTLVQPNKVTNARYEFSPAQEDILTLMIDAVQKHMTNEREIQTDLFGEPTISIDIEDSNNKYNFFQAALGMTEKRFEFEWTRSQDNKNIKTAGVLVTTVHDVKQTKRLELTINKWAIPYLVYWGKGVGGTVFNKAVALTLKGEYTKRLYKLCKRWEDKGGFSMSLQEFRLMMKLEKKYSKLAELRRWVLESSIERMKDGADVYFTYSLDKIGGSRSYNQINFVVHGNNKRKGKKEKTDLYVLVYNMLCFAWPNYESSKAQEICDRIAENPDKFEELYRRMKKLKDEYDSGEKTREDLNKLIKHIIKNDY